MNWLWTWGGMSFGYRDGDDLWTFDGHHVARFDGDEIYGPDGRYLGELMNCDRLITHRSKRNWRGARFRPYGRRIGYVRYVNYVGYVMYAGFEDFPPPEALH
ncbi:hypothetical protein [Sphingopyxis terrae]|uniref:hypothetical protein n=1 Tax=Sphingopyxis terrae TaxID=33052 RepID=UPI001C2BD9C9|nr:hypothetical protein [Sphingopyxis terrae]QXF12884.1 hypothetical protein HBA51_12525 [Sphingopyxis terrae subsp. terrae]